MKNVCIVLLLVVANAIPAWGQLFTPQQIDEIQEVYLSSSSSPVTPPYGLPQQAQDVQQGDQNNTLRDTLLYNRSGYCRLSSWMPNGDIRPCGASRTIRCSCIISFPISREM